MRFSLGEEISIYLGIYNTLRNKYLTLFSVSRWPDACLGYPKIKHVIHLILSIHRRFFVDRPSRERSLTRENSTKKKKSSRHFTQRQVDDKIPTKCSSSTECKKTPPSTNSGSLQMIIPLSFISSPLGRTIILQYFNLRSWKRNYSPSPVFDPIFLVI